MALIPQGMKGFGAALQEAYPLLLAMSQGMRQGDPFAQSQQGLAAMMAMQEKRKADAERAAAQGMTQDFFGNMANKTPVDMANPMAPKVTPSGGLNPMIAGAVDRVDPQYSALPASLVGTESGGNFAARNNAVGSSGRPGHFGRGQFGQDRLDEAKRAGVIPADMTPEQFLASPQAQQRVEKWHVGDISGFIGQNGLDRYVGQQINGVTVTPRGMLAVAHLGGKAGLRRFLETGGQYNPSDANGTSLLDYMGTHGGGGEPRISPERAAAIMASPYVPDAVKQMVFAQFAPQQQQNRETATVGGYLVDENTGEVIFAAPDGGGKPSAVEEQIARIQDAYGVDRKTAVGIADGVVTISRDPLTGESVVIDKITGQPVNKTQVPEPLGAAATPADPALSFGPAFQNAPQSFGLEGALRSGINTAADVLPGVATPFPETQQSQSDFAVLKETLVRDISNSYDHDPPAALLQAIRTLAPTSGSVFEGPDAALAKLNSLGRSFETEKASLEAQLAGRLSPDEREKLRGRMVSINRAMSQVAQAREALGPTATGNTTASGVTWSVVE